MKARYRLTRRGSRGNTCYSVESATGNRTSLKTDNRRKAQRLVDATNEAEQPCRRTDASRTRSADCQERGSRFPRTSCTTAEFPPPTIQEQKSVN